MDQNQQDITFDEGLKEVVQSLPPIIRAYLSEKKYIPIMKGLMGRYGLHVDQGGIFEREMVLLLMGVETPEEFARSLQEEAQIPEDVVDNIVADIDEQIFFPLWEEERKESPESSVTETKKAIHHELLPVMRKIQVTSPPQEAPQEQLSSSPMSQSGDAMGVSEVERTVTPVATSPTQAIPKLIIPVPAVPPKTQEKPNPFPIPEYLPETSVPKTPPAPIQSYTVDPYREPLE